MIAVDTNVLVRFLVRDDATHASGAAALVRANSIWVSKTVLLETEWVLRSLYGFSPQTLAQALRGMAGLPQVVLEDELEVAKALDWFQAGLDLADALHLASALRARSGSSAQGANEFVTFDRKLAKQASRLTGVEIVSL